MRLREPARRAAAGGRLLSGSKCRQAAAAQASSQLTRRHKGAGQPHCAPLPKPPAPPSLTALHVHGPENIVLVIARVLQSVSHGTAGLKSTHVLGAWTSVCALAAADDDSWPAGHRRRELMHGAAGLVYCLGRLECKTMLECNTLPALTSAMSRVSRSPMKWTLSGLAIDSGSHPLA